MFNLIIVIISIALSAILVLSTVFYGGSLFRGSLAKGRAAIPYGS